MLKNLKIKNLLLIFTAAIVFGACASKSEQEYNKPALYWYNKMMMQIGMNDLDEADDTYTSLESEHRNSPYIPTRNRLKSSRTTKNIPKYFRIVIIGSDFLLTSTSRTDPSPARME